MSNAQYSDFIRCRLAAMALITPSFEPIASSSLLHSSCSASVRARILRFAPTRQCEAAFDS
jgi:hypothetical protein